MDGRDVIHLHETRKDLAAVRMDDRDEFICMKSERNRIITRHVKEADVCHECVVLAWVCVKITMSEVSNCQEIQLRY